MLKQIIDFLNLRIAALNYCEELFCLCEIKGESGGDVKQPMQRGSNGEWRKVNFDEFNGVGYWRLRGDVTTEDAPTIVSGKKRLNRTFPLRFVLAVPRDKVTVDDAYSFQRMAVSVEKVVTVQLGDLQLQLGAAKVTVSVNTEKHDPKEVWDAETDNTQTYEPKYELLYGALDMTVVVTADVACFVSECADPDTDILHTFDFCKPTVRERLTDAQVACLEAALCETPPTLCEQLAEVLPADVVADVFDCLTPEAQAELLDSECVIPPCADSTITINGAEYGTVPSGGTENIIVESENNNPLGSLVGGNWEVGNAHLRVNGTTVGNLEPEQWHDHYATINGTQAGSWHNPSQTWRMNVLQGGAPVGSLSGTDWVVPPCAAATAVLKNTANTTLSTTSIASGASQNITAPDATAVLKNTANTTLLTEAIPSNVSENITAPDGTYLHRDSAGNSIGSGSIMSGQIGVIIIAPDGSYSLRDTASNVLATGNIRSNQTGVVITAPDGTYSLRNTSGTVLGTGSIRSGQLSVVITAPDATITLNGSAYGSAPSGTTFNVDTQTITPLTTTNILTSFGFKQSIAGTTPNLFRFRKNTGGTEFNVAADVNGYPDVTTAQTSLGADSAFLVRVYDLSGNGRDAYWTASTAPQPRLAMAAGSSKRQVQAAHITNQYMQCDCPITAGQAWTLYMALTPNEMAGAMIACGGTGATFKWWLNTDLLNRVYLYDGVSQNPVTSNYSVVQRAPMVLAVQFKTNELRVYANGTLILSHNTWSVLASSMFQIARRVDGGGSIGQFNWNGVAAYTGDYSASINTAFTNIYQP